METMLTLPAIKHEIKKCLSNEPSIAHIIIFGSYVNNSVHEDSDIDLVVILKEKGIDSTYRQRMDRTIRISKLLNPLRKHIAINVLVYTKGEWVYLIKKGSHFLKEIDKKGSYLPS
jgi:predicted nucleotidyltransferase